MKKIYFACSITGGRKDEHVYQKLVEHMEDAGFQVPTAHIAQSGVEEMDERDAPRDIYQRDVAWIEECDLLVAEVSTPSHGVGFEIGYALQLEKPVLCLYQQDRKISKMISGNPDPLLTVQAYGSARDAVQVLSDHLTRIVDHRLE